MAPRMSGASVLLGFGCRHGASLEWFHAEWQEPGVSWFVVRRIPCVASPVLRRLSMLCAREALGG
jgi:hypothetical protein